MKTFVPLGTKVVDKVKWFKRMAGICTILGCYCPGEVMDTSAAEREPSSKSSSDERESSVRYSKAPPVETKGRPASFKEIDIYAKLRGADSLSDIGDILRRRQEVVDLFSAALYKEHKADPNYTAFLEPMLHAAPSAPQDAAHKRAAQQERAR